MLSHEDEQRLAAIERELMSDDPALARRLARHSRTTRMRCGRVLAAIIAILCALATLVGALAESAALVVSAAALTVVAGWFVYRSSRSRR
jgi:Protein of unknown function (DUF3040)